MHWFNLGLMAAKWEFQYSYFHSTSAHILPVTLNVVHVKKKKQVQVFVSEKNTSPSLCHPVLHTSYVIYPHEYYSKACHYHEEIVFIQYNIKCVELSGHVFFFWYGVSLKTITYPKCNKKSFLSISPGIIQILAGRKWHINFHF